ncbi:hypothetical protein RF683_07450 [Flavobacterium sp. 20NA77.7]|uniref:Signal peptidase n=1 Tax=Flavobacterium nakdongensis TaxID=3073563 RepID=A0ABY9R841_9FLAO|nr:hypothetical protein [Flavobacterium sp. 20NA77.7]WMW77324.1 hypothetical protein RF683_07450 [Flavobacterium sp. 20NA77.7]
MKKKTLKLLLIITNLIAFSNILSAQTNDPIEPPPPVPINDYVNFAIIFAILIAIYFIYNFETNKENL